MMWRASLRPWVAVASFAAFLGAESRARAAPEGTQVEIATDGSEGEKLQIFDRTDQVTMAPIRVGRYTHLARGLVYAPVCPRMPCMTRLREGSHHLALSQPGGAIVEGDAPVRIEGPSTVTGTYSDRSTLRYLGGVTLVLGTGTAIGMILAARRTHESCGTGLDPRTSGCTQEQTVDTALVAAAGGVLFGSLIASLVLLGQSDSVSFRVTPIVLGASGRQEGMALPNGLALSMRF